MLTLKEIEKYIFSKLQKEIPIFLEDNNKLLTPICFDITVQSDAVADQVDSNTLLCYDIFMPDYKKEYIVEEEGLEIFPQDLWEDNYISKFYYIRDWISCNFPLIEKQSTNINNICIQSHYTNLNSFIKARKTDENWTIKDQLELVINKNKYLLFPFCIGGADFYATYLSGIGVNKRPIYIGFDKIDIGEALIFNTTPCLNGTEICDFSLYQYNQIRSPKKPSPNLFHSLISERRKIYE